MLKVKSLILSMGLIVACLSVSVATDPPSDTPGAHVVSSDSQTGAHTGGTSVVNYDRSLAHEGVWRFFSQIDEKSYFSFLSALMDPASQREDWYKVSPYIAEFYCFTSNLAILGVGLYDKAWPTIFAGLMSGLSHAVPTQFAHHLDRVGVAVVGVVALFNIAAIYNSPALIYIGLAALTLNLVDTIFTRAYGSAAGPWPHVAWHLMAAVALHSFDQVVMGA